MTSTLDLGKLKTKEKGHPVPFGRTLLKEITLEHLANYCSEAPALTVRKYLTKVLEREDKINKKRKIVGNNQLTMTDYHDSTKIPDARITRINRALAKFFVACGNYVVEVIGEVIDKIGPNKISAVVSDNALNVRNACKIIKEKYPNIENVRCIAHAINLIACDILKESFGSFFKNSHQAGARLTQLIKENSIHRGRMKLYCKTCWTTASESVDSIIRLELIPDLGIGLSKTKLIQEFLPRIARHLSAICPNSASCERGFSTLGWLFNDRHLNLNINRLESTGKMIMHWKSNAKKELGFYSIEKNNTHISETKMNIRIAEALTETNDDDDECDVLLNESLPNQITIPPNNCIVLIEHIWIDKFVDLSHKLVIEEVGEIPDDILDDSEEEYEHINTDDSNDEEQESNERGNYDYDVEELLDEFINEDVEDYEDE
ncbi:zinc finger BED domain-containing protein 1-like [Rhizophagus irregularis DAOM 181602=DAOM 197198]|nr:zinc finger BED domain-containing protein 1-like [Rhizophagus irregularis DAOM 181602=DAOM 197198]